MLSAIQLKQQVEFEPKQRLISPDTSSAGKWITLSNSADCPNPSLVGMQVLL